MTERLTNQELYAKIEYHQKILDSYGREFTLSYSLSAIGIILLIVGWANYSDSWLGILALVGLILTGIGIHGYFDTRKGAEATAAEIRQYRAILRDRGAA